MVSSTWNGPTKGRNLFDDGHETFDLPELAGREFDQAFDEIELLGFPLRPPFDLPEDGKGYAGAFAKELKGRVGLAIVIEGYYVCRKDVRTVKGELMYFGTWLDREGRFFDTVHFPNFVKMSPFRGKGTALRARWRNSTGSRPSK